MSIFIVFMNCICLMFLKFTSGMMNSRWNEESMGRKYDNDTNILIEEYDKQSITSR